MTSLEEAAASVLYQALAVAPGEIGLIVRVESTIRAKAVLYNVRKKLADPTLSKLQIRFSAVDPDHELWIIRLDAEVKKEPKPEASPPDLSALE